MVSSLASSQRTEAEELELEEPPNTHEATEFGHNDEVIDI